MDVGISSVRPLSINSINNIDADTVSKLPDLKNKSEDHKTISREVEKVSMSEDVQTDITWTPDSAETMQVVKEQQKDTDLSSWIVFINLEQSHGRMTFIAYTYYA